MTKLVVSMATPATAAILARQALPANAWPIPPGLSGVFKHTARRAARA